VTPGDATFGVAIPFHSRLDYLEEALRSLVRQDDHAWRAVVVDDASEERGARELVDGLRDERVTYVRNERNLGLAGNFNRCLREPGTDTVAILHADDVLERGYVATVRAAHARHPGAACVAPGARAIDADGRPITTIVDRVKRARWPRDPLLAGDEGLARLMHTWFVYTPAISYRPALLPHDPFPSRWQQVMDVELFADVLLSGGEIALEPTVVYRYRRHAGTTTSANARAYTRLAEETALAREIERRAAAAGWSRTRRAARLRWSVRANGVVAVASGGVGGPARRAAVRDVLRPR